MREELRRMAMVTSGVVELTRNRAEQIVKDLMTSGDVRKDQTSGVIKELLKRSAENRKELAGFVRSEIRNQMESFGVASKRDLERLERRINRLEAKPADKPPVAKKRTTSKPSKTAAANQPQSKASKAPKPSGKAASDGSAKG